MEYDDFTTAFDSWEGLQRLMHTLPDSNPTKKYYKKLMDDLLKLPPKEREMYFRKRYGL